MGGILFVSCGSGGERILSEAFVDHDNLRSESNYFFAVNTSDKDHERVHNRFDEARLGHPDNFETFTIGKEELSGFGAGKDPSLGLRAYKADRERVLERISTLHDRHNFRIAFTFGTLGGGSGTLTLPEISKDIEDETDLRVVPLCTVPFRREGELLIGNALGGLHTLSEYGMSPLIFDNERMMNFSDSVAEGVEEANAILTLLISSLVDLVEYSGFSVPPIDIIDLTRLISPQCGAYHVAFTDNPKEFKSDWKSMLDDNKSIDSEPLEDCRAFVMFKAKNFPHSMTEDILSWLRRKYNLKEIIPTTAEDPSFVGYTVLAIVWGLGIDEIEPKLEAKKPLLERIIRI